MKQIGSLFVFCVLTLFTSLNLNAQRTCTAVEAYEHQKAHNPQFEEMQNQIERFTQEYVANHTGEGRVVITIPVVFHIIHNGDAVGTSENISDTYINAQLAQLNADFRKTNADASSIPSAFSSVAADCEIQFCLAARKPDGTATTGIERLNMTNSSWTMSQIESSLKPQTIWDRNKYLNLWTVIFGGTDAGTLGYAQFPGGTANTDGVVLLYSSVGSLATPNSAGGAYGKGRTATHEIGHWLNLRHIWGDATCGSDLVSDTPTHNAANYGCPTYPHASTCTGAPTEMTMDYMDYTDDGCMYMFTAGQKARMQALFATGGSRVSLATSDGCTAPSGGTTTCGVPSALTSSSITSTGATISWTAASGATSYNVQYKLSTATTWTSTTSTTTSKALSGLSASSTYNFQVQSVCSTGTSAYSTASSFTTTSGTTTSCTDNYETNESTTAAKTIAVNTVITAKIGTSTDKDYFKFTNTSTARNIKVELYNLPADYDLKLYRGTTLVGTSQNSSTTAEKVIYNNGTITTYYAYVYGYNGAYNSSTCYNLKASISSSTFVKSSENGDDQIVELEPATEEEIAQLDIPFMVIPNPTSGEAMLQFALENDENVTISVTGLMGQNLLTLKESLYKGHNQVALQFENAPNGVYFVKVSNGKLASTQRVIVQH
ncbi:MAG: T9SS type A sorting domain-containing protein [Saprospiraceae bacterium]|nr:T9SS type A sorting domain-containing protein [Saprospiraceae bacterium]